MADDHKTVLRRYLRIQRESLAHKLGGLFERDARAPMTPTGTNVLGVFKHVVSVEAGYLGVVFGRPFPAPTPWLAMDAEPNADLWSTPEQTIARTRDFAARVWTHTDRTIADLELDSRGWVPWWGERGSVTLQQILVHLIAEYARHGGHMDVVRELIDGQVGTRVDDPNLPSSDPDWWARYVRRLRAVADQFPTS